MSIANKEIYATRRQRLADQIGKGAIAVLSANQVVIRNGDADYPFRQNSHFYYFTGFQEPEAFLVIVGGQASQSILFNRPRELHAEQWTGARLGQDDAPTVLGVTSAYSIQTFETKLLELATGMETIYYAIAQDRFCEPIILNTIAKLKTHQRAGVSAPYRLADSTPLVSEMRLFKDAEELKLMQKAADISVLAHQRAMKACQHAKYEYQLEAELRYVFTQQGCRGVAYEPIVAAGKNACVLHYTDNQAPLRSGELVLIDAAGEFENYAADITRTFPVNGKFSGEQRALYELVLHAQRSAIEAIQPGMLWSSIQEKILTLMTQGLCDLGILSGKVEDLIETKAYLPFYMHNSGHWLGLDVHDSGQYKQAGQSRVLRPNMVLTVEPGLYISDNVPQVDARWHHIGIRIEDDILVTSQGHTNLSGALCVEIGDIEAWMSDAISA